MHIDFDFATQDDCLDKMVPSDLMGLVVERDQLQEQVDSLRDSLEQTTDQLMAKIDELAVALVATHQPRMDYIPQLGCTITELLNRTPHQFLAFRDARVRAAALREFADWCVTCEEHNNDYFGDAANEFADRLQGEINE